MRQRLRIAGVAALLVALAACSPYAGKGTDLNGAIALFRQTCLAHTPDLGALRQAAVAAGMEVKSGGTRDDSLFAGQRGSGVTLQVNVNTTASYECAVVYIDDGDSDPLATREALLAAAGGPRVRIAGTDYAVVAVSTEALGITQSVLALRRP